MKRRKYIRQDDWIVKCFRFHFRSSGNSRSYKKQTDPPILYICIQIHIYRLPTTSPSIFSPSAYIPSDYANLVVCKTNFTVFLYHAEEMVKAWLQPKTWIVIELVQVKEKVKWSQDVGRRSNNSTVSCVYLTNCTSTPNLNASRQSNGKWLKLELVTGLEVSFQDEASMKKRCPEGNFQDRPIVLI